MSLKQLEETIKNRHLTNIVQWRAKHPKEPMTMFEQCACDLENQFRKVEVAFAKFKKQNICIPKKQLEELLKTRPRFYSFEKVGRIRECRDWFGKLKKLLEESK